MLIIQKNIVIHNAKTHLFLNSIILSHISGEKKPDVIPSQFDKDEFYRLINEHRLGLIAYPLIKNNNEKQINCLKKIKMQYEMQCCLLNLINEFSKNNINYAVLKGIPLNAQLYEKAFFRISGDIDLLINPHDLLMAEACLIKQGFILDNASGTSVAPAQLLKESTFMMNYLKDLTYINKKYNFHVELHWRCMQPPMIDFHPVRENKLTSQIVGHTQPVAIFDNEHNFLYLCAHAAFHSWQRLQWLIDIAVFYKKIPLDWNKLILIAKQYQLTRHLLEARILLKEWGIDLPDIACTKRDLCVIHFHLRYARKIQHHHSIKSYEDVMYSLLLCPSWKQKWEYMVGIVLQSRASCRLILANPSMPKNKVILKTLFQRFFHCVNER